MRWSVSQYGDIWDATYAHCDQHTQEILDRRLDTLCEYGNRAERPVSAPLGDGIFELRANSARMLFYFGKKRDIIFVNCFIKKVRRVPREEIKLAKKRRNDITMQGIKTNDLPN